MCDSAVISRLFSTVLQEHVRYYDVNSADIRAGIQNMKEVYKPEPGSLSSGILDVANYNDPAHRCAYLHKYAPLHTALVADMMKRAIYQNPELFADFIINFGSIKICSLGGGPGSDIIGVLAVLTEIFGLFQVSATVIDCMPKWKETFIALIHELRVGNYGTLGECVSEQYFEWSYIGNNLLGKMTNQVQNGIQAANLVTMVKFVSAAACKDTSTMIKKIFRSLKPGSLVLYIDNAGGGFHQMIRKEADSCNLITVFGPVKHELYTNHNFNVKRFGYTPCLETRVSVHVWQKPVHNLLNNLNFISHSPEDRIPTSLRQFNQSTEIVSTPRQPVNPVYQFGGMNSRVTTNFPQPMTHPQTFHNTSNTLPEPTFDYQPDRYIYAEALISNTRGVQSIVANQYIIDTRGAGIPPEVRSSGIRSQGVRSKRQAPRAPAIQSQPYNYLPVNSQQNRNNYNNRAVIEEVVEEEDDKGCGCCVIS
ncbi:uncharacterized protein NPIL_457331 [Nephila pilipes]|uniref:Uncharacterized protein n=1 Tax=Nephila pilipes TaxID=299642 RepID=A0A8X6QF84_NEPPI|nr:uncharacterized protein NPIL_457331 [Nephila pilipes]